MDFLEESLKTKEEVSNYNTIYTEYNNELFDHGNVKFQNSKFHEEIFNVFVDTYLCINKNKYNDFIKELTHIINKYAE